MPGFFGDLRLRGEEVLSRVRPPSPPTVNDQRTTSVLTGAKLALLRACLRGLPARNYAVVAGFPDDEGNSVELVRGLAPHLPVYWLIGSDDPQSLGWLIRDSEAAANVRCLRRDTVRAYLSYATARYAFFTHGLYGSPQPPKDRVFVNLWHGDGPKRRKGFANIGCTFIVSGTQLWGEQRVRNFGVSRENVLVTGNPRIDQFRRPAGDRALRQLGIDPALPLVMWLPTYRKTDYRGNRLGAIRNWSDAGTLSGSSDVQQLLTRVSEDAREQGMTLAVKPHQLDGDQFAALGMHVITNEGLRRAEVSLYQLLARTHGLITDYSSVWTDYLVLDRPLGFYCPDLAEYTANRGLNVDDYPSLLPGPLLETEQEFVTFLRHCVDEPLSSRSRRKQSIGRIGAETRPGATDRLLQAIGLPQSPKRQAPTSGVVAG